jgi:hypothetical protein
MSVEFTIEKVPGDNVVYRLGFIDHDPADPELDSEEEQFLTHTEVRQMRGAIYQFFGPDIHAVRFLQDAANMLSYDEWLAVTHFARDAYSSRKFAELQEVGRLLGHFDDGVLLQTLQAYRHQVSERARGA